MGKTLVVVESPAKAKTIKKYLGAGYEVLASKGHVKDLPKKMGVDVENGFKETYEVIEGKEKVLAELKAAAKKADDILLATDPDREGEAIAWHIAEELDRQAAQGRSASSSTRSRRGRRSTASHNPRKLDENLYDAQRARRVLDRIVGYDVSALVWSKLAFGLSRGSRAVASRCGSSSTASARSRRSSPRSTGTSASALARRKARRSRSRRGSRSADGEKLEVNERRARPARVQRRPRERARTASRRSRKREQKRNAPAPYTT